MASLGLPLGTRRAQERAGFALYAAAVAAARTPFLYTDLHVPDTLDGRFEMVSLHVFLLIERLRSDASPGPELAQAVFDAMFSDMDVNLREMGVGDLSVGKKVRAMWEALHGRAAAYRPALACTTSPRMMRDALARNVWRGAPAADASVDRLVRLAFAQAAHLALQPLAAFQAGLADFLPAREACR